MKLHIPSALFLFLLATNLISANETTINSPTELKLDMTSIPAGGFLMGNKNKDGFKREEPLQLRFMRVAMSILGNLTLPSRE